MTRTLFVFVSKIKIELQELKFWLILFASVFFWIEELCVEGIVDESPGDGRFVLGMGL
jgi:hypothetical protein